MLSASRARCCTAISIDATNGPDPANGDNEVFVQIWDSGSCAPVVAPQLGTWTIRLRVVSTGGAGGSFDLWDQSELGGFAGSVPLAAASASGTASTAICAAPAWPRRRSPAWRPWSSP